MRIAAGCGSALLVLMIVDVAAAQKPRAMDQALRAEMLDMARLADERLGDSSGVAPEGVEYRCHYLRGPLLTYVPCAIDLLREAFRDSAVYLRVMRRNDAGDVLEEQEAPEPTFKGTGATGIFYWTSEGRVSYPVEDIHFVEAPPAREGVQRISRAVMVKPGTYDLFIVIRERPYVSEPRRSVVIRAPLDVPDFRNGRLSAGSIMAVDEMSRLDAPLSEREQVERPFALGSVEVVPARGLTFDADQDLRIVMPVYNAAGDGGGKPDVTVEYDVELARDPGLIVAALGIQRFDADTLPDTFDVERAGGLFVTQSVPVDVLGAGHYRLRVRVSDERSGESAVQTLPFHVR